MPITRIHGEKYIGSIQMFKYVSETVRWQQKLLDITITNYPGLKCKSSGVHDVSHLDAFAYEINGSDVVLGIAGLVICQVCYSRLPSEEMVIKAIRKHYKRETVTQVGSHLHI